MYAPPPDLGTEMFARVPQSLAVTDRRSEWLAHRDHGAVTSFLEGPSFGRDGTLYCTDIAFGRILAVSKRGEFTVAAEYEGEPNGMKIHKDGRMFVADQKHGIMVIEPGSRKAISYIPRYNMERFKGPNDLVFASNGDLYFTDQGQSGWQDPTGRLFCQRANGKLELLLDNIPSPNGLVLTPDESTLYLAVTRANAIWRVPFGKGGAINKVGTFVQMSGGIGPDGMAMDEEGSIFVAHPGAGSVWAFNAFGEPIWRIRTAAGRHITNLAFGGDDRKSLFITESSTGTILRAELPVAGRLMFSHM